MTKDEALKLALDAFGEIAWSNETQWQRDRAKKAITAIKEALAQPETVSPGGGLVPAVPVAVYGFGPVLWRWKPRRPNGDDKCTNGHKYPSSKALAQPEQEPVACVGTNGELMWLNKPKVIYSKPIPLYTTPPQRKPLTDVTIWNTYKNLWMFHPAEEPRLAGDVLKFARAIEQAHGIKE